MPFEEWDYEEAAERLGVDPGVAKEIADTGRKICEVFDTSKLEANELYSLTIAVAIRMAKLAGAPSDQLRSKFESILKKTEARLPS